MSKVSGLQERLSLRVMIMGEAKCLSVKVTPTKGGEKRNA
jgi:hypothetical protein